MLIIYKVGLNLYTGKTSENPTIKPYVIQYDATMKNKITEFNDSEGLKKVKKEKLNEIDSIYLDNLYYMIDYHIFCLEDYVENAKLDLLEKVTFEVNRRIQASETMLDLLIDSDIIFNTIK